MRSKIVVPALVVACALGTTDIAFAQANTAAQPAVESATARVKAHHREKTILRPSTATGMSRGTPGARHNFYKESVTDDTTRVEGPRNRAGTFARVNA